MVLKITFHSFRILFNYTIAIGLEFIGTVRNFFFWTKNCIYIETIKISTGFTFKNIFFSAFSELHSTPPWGWVHGLFINYSFQILFD